ncbi:MBL fold metallo-hydrolase [Sphingomonas sp. ID1715]|uniref:MBL fold metallo-hydrolase n=1 Tax=Sphingomonas sp. ID1715 TaxID=1656898 RepID=UPI0014893872|nr:MBL fold metallo-hydrolase [Sphingomonas sp. ID1715]NNM78126.1 MBL fold metallo-hydrolase [Sphingomonas sp. ID1715]
MRALLVLLFLLATPVQAASWPPFDSRQLARGIHLLTMPDGYVGAAISNVTVIEQRDGMVVIDSGATAGHGRAIVGFVRSLGPKPVKALLITHWHNDHPLGASELQRAWPHMRIIATQATRRHLAGKTLSLVGRQPDEKYDVAVWNQVSGTRAQFAQRRNLPDTSDEQRARFDRATRELEDFARSYPGTHIVVPTESFTDRLTIADPERPVELRFFGRANTDGDALAWLPRQRIILTGDIVVAPLPFGFFSYPGEWIDVLAKVKALDFALLVPGHGAPQEDSAYLDKLTVALNDLRTQIGPMAREGLTLDEVRKRFDPARQKAAFVTSPRLERAFEANWLSPMIVNSWLEARGQAFVQGDQSLYK